MAPKNASTSKNKAVTAPSKKSKPAKPAPVFKTLTDVGEEPVGVTAQYEGDAEFTLTKSGRYSHQLNLESSAKFSLLNIHTITEGTKKGVVVIELQPPKTFDFDGLPLDVRARIYSYYFAPKGILGDPIIVEAKRKTNGNTFAKLYSEGSQYRVALVATCRAIHQEATPVLYGRQAFRLESTTSLFGLLNVLTVPLRKLLRAIEIKTYVKAGAHDIMSLLATAPNLRRLRIEHGVARDEDPAKAAKAFWFDANQLLEVVGKRIAAQVDTPGVAGVSRDGEDESEDESDASPAPHAVDILEFGDQALVKPGKNKQDRAYAAEEKQLFLETLRAKMT